MRQICRSPYLTPRKLKSVTRYDCVFTASNYHCYRGQRYQSCLCMLETVLGSGARNCPMNLGSVGRRPEWSTGAQSCPEMVEAAHGSSELPYESRKCRQEIGMVQGSSGLSGHARNCPRKVGVVPSHIWGRNSSVLKKNTISNLQRRIEMYAQGLQRTVLAVQVITRDCAASRYR